MITRVGSLFDWSVCFERLTRRLLDVSQLLKVLRSSLIEIQERCNFSRPSFFPHRVSTHQPKFWLRLNCKLRLSNHLLLHFTILLGNDSKYVGGVNGKQKTKPFILQFKQLLKCWRILMVGFTTVNSRLTGLELFQSQNWPNNWSKIRREWKKLARIN